MSPRKRAVAETAAEATGSSEPSPEEYAAFIQQVELLSFWLASARIENAQGPTPPADLAINIQAKYRFESTPEGFDAFASYRSTFGRVEEVEPESFAEVTFGLRFASEQPMTDTLFDVFSDVNLPLNAWPFLREFLQSVTARMGWPVLTIPTFKVGASEPRAPRARRKPSRAAPEETEAEEVVVDKAPAEEG